HKLRAHRLKLVISPLSRLNVLAPLARASRLLRAFKGRQTQTHPSWLVALRGLLIAGLGGWHGWTRGAQPSMPSKPTGSTRPLEPIQTLSAISARSPSTIRLQLTLGEWQTA